MTSAKTPKSRSRKKAPTFPAMARSENPGQVWFSRSGCVVRRDGRVEVFVDGSLLASYEECETGIRNVLLVMLAKKEAVVLEKLAEAFGISSEALRLIRRTHESEGLDAVVRRMRGGNFRKPKVTKALRRQMEALFVQGLSVSEVHLRVQGKVSRGTVGNVRKRWAETRAADAGRAAEPQQRMLSGIASVPETDAHLPMGVGPGTEPGPCCPAGVEEGPGARATKGSAAVDADAPGEVANRPEGPAACVGELEPKRPGATDAGPAHSESDAKAPAAIRAPRSDESARCARDSRAGGVDDEPTESDLSAGGPVSRRSVQALGSWLLVAMVAQGGFYNRIRTRLVEGLVWRKVRIAIDAVLIALATRQKCVEGVRRLATSGAAALLLATGAPTPGWARRILGTYCRDGVSGDLLLDQAGDLIRQAYSRREENRPVVFFVDNHSRPYTGQHRVMWCWRMQDKRPRPGASDYYVHDHTGRPVFRVALADHGSLAQVLLPISALLKVPLEDGAKILVGFDRGGSFPEVMKAIRKVPQVEFVTYERAPYRKLPRQRFETQGKIIEIEGDRPDEKQAIPVIEDQCNLGKGRGRVRRLRLLMPDDGAQVNVLTNSTEDAEWLVRTLFGRWRQENGFKYGVERWGINQLDGRKVEAFAPDTIITNPKKRRLKRELDELRQREGTLRRELARFGSDSTARQRSDAQLALTLRRLARVDGRYQQQPEHIALKETELDGKLVHHPTEYKTMIDTLRVVGTNAEAELASYLAPHLKRPKEAKRALQNLFTAAGDITVRRESITVCLDPAGTRNEREAFKQLLTVVNRWKLRHPGDPSRRPLRFRVQDG